MRQVLAILLLVLLQRGDAIACETANFIAELSENDGQLSPLTRPAMQHNWAVPGGIFRIHYDTEGPLAVYHADEDIDPLDGIPDYVNRTADFLSLSYSIFIQSMGFDAPPSDDGEGGDSLYDIYLTDVHALTSPESPSDEYPERDAYTSFIQLGHDMRTQRYPDDPYPFLKVCAAHEYFHAVQFAYRAYSSDITPWWFESCAGWAEEIVFDEINDVYYKLSDYLPHLHKSLYQTGGFFDYGSWLFAQYLSERFGHSVIRECWNKFVSFDFALDAITLVLDDIGFEFNEEYALHIIWNYFTAVNYRPGFYEEGESFDETVYEAVRHQNFPFYWIDQPIPQQNVSGAYIVFQSRIVYNGSLIIEYFNPTDDKQAVAIAVVRTDSPVEYNIYPIQNGIASTFIVRDFASSEKVIMMPIWYYEGFPIEGTTSYSYRAYIDSIFTGIPEQIDETAESFELMGAYPNPFNSAVSISFDSPSEGMYTINVYDIIGRLIFSNEGWCKPGSNGIIWTPPDDLAGGVLYYEVELGQNRLYGKMIYLK